MARVECKKQVASLTFYEKTSLYYKAINFSQEFKLFKEILLSKR